MCIYTKLINKKGFTLLETIIALFIFSVLLLFLLNLFLFSQDLNNNYYNKSDLERDFIFALNYIEKEIATLNKLSLEYIEDEKLIRGKNVLGDQYYIDFSGENRYNQNVLIYFSKETNELRINKNNENNVFLSNIKEVNIESLDYNILKLIFVNDEFGVEITKYLSLRSSL